MQCKQERTGEKGKSDAITCGQEPRVYIRNLNLNHAYMHANEFQNCGQGSARMKRNTNAKTFKDIPMHPRWIAANAPNKLNIARRYSLALADFLAAGVFIWSNFIFFGFFGSQVSRFQNSQIPDYHVPTFSHFQIPRFPDSQITKFPLAQMDDLSDPNPTFLPTHIFIYICIHNFERSNSSHGACVAWGIH